MKTDKTCKILTWFKPGEKINREGYPNPRALNLFKDNFIMKA